MQSIITMVTRADRFCFNVINGSIRCTALDKSMPYVTHLGSTVAGALICFLLLALDKLGILEAGIFVPITLFISQAIIHSIKLAINRPRPRITLLNINLHALYTELKNHSFPSGHTGAAFAIAFSMNKIIQPGILMEIFVLLAVLVGLSRMYLGVHYPTDVFFGAMISIATVMIAYKYIHIFIDIIE